MKKVSLFLIIVLLAVGINAYSTMTVNTEASVMISPDESSIYSLGNPLEVEIVLAKKTTTYVEKNEGKDLIKTEEEYNVKAINHNIIFTNNAKFKVDSVSVLESVDAIKIAPLYIVKPNKSSKLEVTLLGDLDPKSLIDLDQEELVMVNVNSQSNNATLNYSLHIFSTVEEEDIIVEVEVKDQEENKDGSKDD